MDHLNQKLARLCFAVTAVCCLFGVVLELWFSYFHESILPPNAGFTRTFGPGWGSFFNQFVFFTTQSNIILGITTLLLALEPRRSSDSFHIWRLIGLIDISITAIVFNFVLANGPSRGPISHLASIFEHSINPILAILGWFVFGPSGSVTVRRIVIAAMFPIAYAAFTLIRGAILIWYPYNILDVTNLGYSGVSIYIVAIFILFLLIAGVLFVFDRWIRSRLTRT
ncbi:hypothetical protein EHQ53_15245 [Leptospira langatensis]|uniref:Uncharacterized protein n=2 Tax=Leptospira langatensis TaxID=2484983 RepID=A0A5F1ZQR0_9LEPT|nr:hypothetical protein EHO57_08485 [Leptospira langatensis]TGL39542.1 hypothetical protein EHQ53_15245 [Leptospira langatensis]